MHEHRIPNPRRDDDEVDRALVSLLLNGDAAGPWSLDELAREIGDVIVVQDSLGRLYGAGLIHRIGGFVFATRAALRATRLTG